MVRTNLFKARVSPAVGAAEADAALDELLGRNFGLLRSDADLDGITSYVQPAPFTVQQVSPRLAFRDAELAGHSVCYLLQLTLHLLLLFSPPCRPRLRMLSWRMFT